MRAVEEQQRSYKVETFADIVRALREHPEWLEELRRLILTEELLELPKKFDKFVKEQFVPLKNKVGVIERDVAELKSDVAELKGRVGVIERDVAELKRDVAKLKVDVGELKGESFERKVRERAPAYFGKLLRRVRLVSFESVADILDDAIERGVITDEDKSEVMWSDGVVKGKLKGTGEEVWIVFEASYVVDKHDIERALKRAVLLKKVLVGVRVLPVVIGKEYAVSKEKAEQMGVIVL